MKQFIAVFVAAILVLPISSFAVTQEELSQKIQELTRQLEELKKQVEGQKVEGQLQEKRLAVVEEKTDKVDKKWSWLEIGGDYRFRIDSLKGEVHDYYKFEDVLGWMLGGPPPALQEGYDVENESIMFNRFRLKVNARVTEDIEVRSRLAMYKTWGHETTDPIAGNFFGNRAMGVFDGTVGHVPQDNILRVDYAYATWSNIANLPLWFSIGRRASTGGLPTNLRQYTDKGGTEGVAGLLIDYAFDGLTIGAAPYIEPLPGFYAKFCYGRGFDSGFKTDIPGDITPKDTDFMGIFIDPIFT